MNINKPIAFLADVSASVSGSSSAAGEQASAGPWYIRFLPIVMLVPIALLFFFQHRGNKKRENAEREKRNSLRVGDEIITNAGITGTVLAVKEDTFTMETGPAKTKLTLQKWAISSVETIHEDDGVDSLDDDLFGEDDEEE